MNVLGLKEIPIGRLRLPGGMNARQASEHVASRARSIEQTGLIHEPLVRKSDMRVLAGLDRVAAHMRLERETITVKLIECTDAEAKMIEVHENVERRHDPAEQQRLIRSMVDQVEASLPDVPEPDEGTVEPMGRPISKRGRARKLVAKTLGVKPESVRRREKAEERDAEPAEPLETCGVMPSPEFLGQVASLRRLLDDADAKLRLAQGALTAIGTKALPFSAPRLGRMRAAVQEAAQMIRGSRPESVCLYCKSLLGVREACTACLGTGWAASGALATVDARLKNADDPCVVLDGQVVRVADVPGLPEETRPSDDDDDLGGF